MVSSAISDTLDQLMGVFKTILAEVIQYSGADSDLLKLTDRDYAMDALSDIGQIIARGIPVSFVVDYDLSAADVLKRGNFSIIEAGLKSDKFCELVRRGQKKKGQRLVRGYLVRQDYHFGDKPTSRQEVIRLFKARNMRPATILEFLSFAAQHPHWPDFDGDTLVCIGTEIKQYQLDDSTYGFIEIEQDTVGQGSVVGLPLRTIDVVDHAHWGSADGGEHDHVFLAVRTDDNVS